MTHTEFENIKKEFRDEEVRWKGLKINEHVFESSLHDYNEYFEIVIKKINIKERYIIGLDKSQNNKEVKLSSFYTKKELRSYGVKFKK